ncbi:MAG: hypothetical protein ETSY2_04630 [Candidatus Entotheonella gemina]|uniref:DinB-like domain-containing protein n=1 Tax=Candidatus Entotheonella gemina TaxID=1429439 RepID=W4MFX5_9BACT|nr:MAG: hypothetical protein ETSY2_04630 [Candidatus Entotheonella gemina]
MEAKDIVLDGLERIRGSLHRTLDGLTLEESHQQPRSDSNSIAWLVWHLTRVQDTGISGLIGEEPLWVSQGWHAKFDMAADADNDGSGHTPEQVTAFRVPSIESLLDYHDQVAERSKTYVAGLAAEDFDRTLNQPQWQPLPTVGVRLVSVISDNLQHAGQAAYLRGLFQGKGWLPY